MLREHPSSLADLAQKLDVSRQSVHRWRTGEKVPGPAARAKMQAELRIPVHVWGQVAGGQPKPRSESSAKATSSARPTTLEEVHQQLEELDRVIGTEGMMTSDLTRVLAEKTRALGLRARLEKEQELLEDRIIREHPGWVRRRAAILGALRGHPAAARAVAQALAAIEDGDS